MGLSSYPITRLTTFIDADGVGSSIDYWLGNSLVDISGVITGGSLSAQHRPLTADISLRSFHGRFTFYYFLASFDCHILPLMTFSNQS
jgi:hypothetical protein